ncbi:enoyl-CoA hydratase-related protein [Streptomyces sp. NPDC054783]
MNAAVAAGVSDALDELDRDIVLRAGVLTGANGTFSTGMDLKATLQGETPVIPGRGFGGLTEAERTKPLSAAEEGYALGGGFELALACALIVATEDAKIGSPEVKRGLIARGGGVIRLPKTHPPARCAPPARLTPPCRTRVGNPRRTQPRTHRAPGHP